MQYRMIGGLLLAFLIAGCSDSSPVETTLSVLSVTQKDFNGRHIVVSGTLRTFDEPLHYWIENEDLDRVALEGAVDLAPLVGQKITARGKFLYDIDKGRRIEVEELVASSSAVLF